jgi:uncharacterized protein YjbI with pentapeptide repeats
LDHDFILDGKSIGSSSVRAIECGSEPAPKIEIQQVSTTDRRPIEPDPTAEVRILDLSDDHALAAVPQPQLSRATILELLRAGPAGIKQLNVAAITEADLNAADLRGADLCGVNLPDSDLRSACLRRSNLADADLSFSRLDGADLREANLHGADLHGATLAQADRRSAKLNRATLTRSRWSRTDLADWKMAGASLHE